MGRAKEVMSGQPGCLVINHMHITSPIFELLEKSPVNEVLLLYVPQDAGDEVPATVDRFLEIASQTAQGATGYAHGWVVEQLEKEGHEGKLKGYYVFIGWDSVEAHMAYRETEAFKENIPMIRSLAKGLSVVSHWWFILTMTYHFIAPYEIHEVQVIKPAKMATHQFVEYYCIFGLMSRMSSSSRSQ